MAKARMMCVALCLSGIENPACNHWCSAAVDPGFKSQANNVRQSVSHVRINLRCCGIHYITADLDVSFCNCRFPLSSPCSHGHHICATAAPSPMAFLLHEGKQSFRTLYAFSGRFSFGRSCLHLHVYAWYVVASVQWLQAR